MHGVEAFRLTLRQAEHARRDDREAGLLEAPIDLADQIASDAVGLDDGEGALERHSLGPFKNRRMLCGRTEVRIDARVSAAPLRREPEPTAGVYLGARARGNLTCAGSAG